MPGRIETATRELLAEGELTTAIVLLARVLDEVRLSTVEGMLEELADDPQVGDFVRTITGMGNR